MKLYKCIVCNKSSEFKHSKVNLYCSLSCQQKHRTQRIVENWLSGGDKSVWKYSIPVWAKKHLINIRGHCCEVCNTTNWLGRQITLEVDHINGDHQNNNVDNLRLICPNCHSQTDTYKNKNKGNGRVHRRK